MKAALYRLNVEPNLEADYVYSRRRGKYYALFGHLVEYDPTLLHYAAHPRLVPWSRTWWAAAFGWGTWEERGHFHCLVVKTVAYLTVVGPDDGGTTIIPGSHRLGWPQQEIIAAALADDSLIRQVEAAAGSVLLFPESLVHSTTASRSDRERAILVSGYTPPMLREWPGNEISPAFVKTLPERLRPLLSGSETWHWKRLERVQ